MSARPARMCPILRKRRLSRLQPIQPGLPASSTIFPRRSGSDLPKQQPRSSTGFRFSADEHDPDAEQYDGYARGHATHGRQLQRRNFLRAQVPVQPLQWLHHHEPQPAGSSVAHPASSSSIGLPHPRRCPGQWGVLPAAPQRRRGLEGRANFFGEWGATTRRVSLEGPPDAENV